MPPTPYEYGTWLVGIKVPQHYHVLVEDNEYSVPHRYIGRAVTLKLTATSVEVHGESGLLVVHARRTDVSGERITDPAHMPPNHQAMRAQSPQGLLEQAATVGPNVIAFVERHLRDQQNLRGTYSISSRSWPFMDVTGSTPRVPRPFVAVILTQMRCVDFSSEMPFVPGN